MHKILTLAAITVAFYSSSAQSQSEQPPFEALPDKASTCTKQKGIIYLYGDIKPWTSSRVITVIERMRGAGIKEYWLIIHSGGGNTDAGFDFYNFVKSSNLNINTYTSGAAQSSAAMFFLSGKKRVIEKSSALMLHQSSVSFTASPTFNQAELIANAEWMRINDDGAKNTISEVTGKDVSRFSDYFAGPKKYMSANEMINLKVATAIGPHPYEPNVAIADVNENGFFFQTDLTGCE